MDINPRDPSAMLFVTLDICQSRGQSFIPEVVQILSPEQLATFVKMYDGETIKVPTVEEFLYDLRLSQIAYYVYAENKSWDWVTLTYGLNGNDSRWVKHHLENWWEETSEATREFLLGISQGAKS